MLLYLFCLLLLGKGSWSVLNERVVTARYTCEKLPYRDSCLTGFASQFTIRWFAMAGRCCAYPYSYCKGEDDTLTHAALRTQKDCEQICLTSPRSSGGGEVSTTSSQPLELVDQTQTQVLGGQGTTIGPPLEPVFPNQGSCQKLPFKEVCATGLPSQFVLRWFLMNGKCCTYPYGHCTGEDDAQHSPALRTKEQCEARCLRKQGDTSATSRRPQPLVVLPKSVSGSSEKPEIRQQSISAEPPIIPKKLPASWEALNKLTASSSPITLINPAASSASPFVNSASTAAPLATDVTSHDQKLSGHVTWQLSTLVPADIFARPVTEGGEQISPWLLDHSISPPGDPHNGGSYQG